MPSRLFAGLCWIWPGMIALILLALGFIVIDGGNALAEWAASSVEGRLRKEADINRKVYK